MLQLTSAGLFEKNQLVQTGAWLLLAEFRLKNSAYDSNYSSYIYLVRNTEDIIWNRKTWIAFPFDLDDIKESKSEFPEINLKVSNVTRYLQPYIEEYKGLVGSDVVIRVVHSGHLNLNQSELEENFTITSTSANALFVTFKLGGNFPINTRFPSERYLKNFCPLIFKSVSCGYNGATTSCDKTLTACRAMGNSKRFGGYPTIPIGGLYD